MRSSLLFATVLFVACGTPDETPDPIETDVPIETDEPRDTEDDPVETDAPVDTEVEPTPQHGVWLDVVGPGREAPDL